MALAPPSAVLRLASPRPLAPSLRVPTVSSVAYAYLALPERFSSQDVYFGDFFEHGSLVWGRFLVRSWLQYFSLLFYLFIFLSFSSRLCSLSLQIHILSTL